MGTPDEAWKTMIAAWVLIPKQRIVDDIERFVSAVDSIIEAEGCYVSGMDLRNGHRRVMRRMVRRGGGQIQERDRNGVKLVVEEGLAQSFASWEGLTKSKDWRLKNTFFQSPLFVLFTCNHVYYFQ